MIFFARGESSHIHRFFFLHVKAKTAASDYGAPAYSGLSTTALHTGATARERHCLHLHITCQSVQGKYSRTIQIPNLSFI